MATESNFTPPDIEQLSLTEKLNLETAKVTWQEIERFFAKGNLLVVDTDIDLILTAEMIAKNEAKKLEPLTEQEKVHFATPEWVKNHCQEETVRLWAVVVAPYVLCQLIRN
ncbi:DUF2288 family protein [Aliikangiella sp. IMCC44653]